MSHKSLSRILSRTMDLLINKTISFVPNTTEDIYYESIHYLFNQVLIYWVAPSKIYISQVLVQGPCFYWHEQTSELFGRDGTFDVLVPHTMSWIVTKFWTVVQKAPSSKTYKLPELEICLTIFLQSSFNLMFLRENKA